MLEQGFAAGFGGIVKGSLRSRYSLCLCPSTPIRRILKSNCQKRWMNSGMEGKGGDVLHRVCGSPQKGLVLALPLVLALLLPFLSFSFTGAAVDPIVCLSTMVMPLYLAL
jgi:hypothetical protein